MTLTFNGSGIMLVGAKRDTHGIYSITMDEANAPQLSGFSNASAFNQTLYANYDIILGLHTITLINKEEAYIDIDYVSRLQIRRGLF